MVALNSVVPNIVDKKVTQAQVLSGPSGENVMTQQKLSKSDFELLSQLRTSCEVTECTARTKDICVAPPRT